MEITGLAVCIWTGAWHIARHINLMQTIKKRRKLYSETKIQSLAILSCTTEYRVLFAFVPFSVAIDLSCLRKRLKKPGARFHTLNTNEARFKRRASTSQGACGGARARLRTSNGQARNYMDSNKYVGICINHAEYENLRNLESSHAYIQYRAIESHTTTNVSTVTQ